MTTTIEPTTITETELIDLWVDALRSGEYKQGKFALHTEQEEYCCLGVLCSVYQREIGGLDVNSTKAAPQYLAGDRREVKQYVYNESSVNLPLVVKNAIGLRAGTGEFYDDNLGGWTSLVCLNDEENWSFEQIADLIEKRPKRLFYDEERIEE